MAASRLRFGAFLPPFHDPRRDPVRSYQEDIELIERLDQLGFDEVWIGEHHSAGWEPVPSPEMFLALLAGRTHRIRLGSGVVSLPYHNPFHVAERMMFLDLLSRGRAMLGVGPGALATDASMLGIPTESTRARMDDALGVVMRLLSGETVSARGAGYELHEATIQLPHCQQPHVPVTVASTASPSGALAAGRHGAGLLSLGAYVPSARLQLANHWKIAEDTAAEHGKTVDRRNWTLVVPIHVGESHSAAMAAVERGADAWLQKYFIETSGFPTIYPGSDGAPSFRAMVDGGNALVGTPDEVADGIERLRDATGGFGCLLALENSVASQADRIRSYQLLMEEVVPRFTGAADALIAAQLRAASTRTENYGRKVLAQDRAHSDYLTRAGKTNAESRHGHASLSRHEDAPHLPGISGAAELLDRSRGPVSWGRDPG